MIHGLDTGFLVAAEVREHAEHAGARVTLTQVLSAYLFDTEPTDPATLAAVAGALLAAGILACAGPAWRATTVDPMVALRAD